MEAHELKPLKRRWTAARYSARMVKRARRAPLRAAYLEELLEKARRK